ncbi:MULTISPECIES: M23 family metallopeptidase [unclassified Arthrobacter]|uniref:M23 family metallopeptidase n=1 Tax=unclassified Arthrobacter TaxID=235627 RepID=UPI0024DFA44A|nr:MULTISPECIES: M23 family metallopeptidase [unclassified Arthrobacter]MCC9145843.1 M23 family metallopeptidase [Arthrobacter sp. zg-Y919]MDK1277072.1 M23 family metallopeptidase [Arthrobacter sp. zg.Y919]MDM7990814.1 M23 family metallopeptidase [Arthrobacter sp. zg-Y877]WIB03597.1 M23 family metallopeptidase [Arthrobacter sp. zg-Y919]
MSVGGAAQKIAITAATSGLILTAALPTTAAADNPAERQATGADAPVSADPNADIGFARAGLSSEFDPDAKLASVTVAAGSHAVPAAAKGTLSTPLNTGLIQTSGFGHRTSPITGAAGEMHNGQDFAAVCGTAVSAAASGTVVFAGWHAYGGGYRVVVDHGNGVETTYNHLSTIAVSVGAAIERGHLVGASGTTGSSTGCHLHFEVMVNGEVVDPLNWL